MNRVQFRDRGSSGKLGSARLQWAGGNSVFIPRYRGLRVSPSLPQFYVTSLNTKLFGYNQDRDRGKLFLNLNCFKF